jgi:hypothetical protein
MNRSNPLSCSRDALAERGRAPALRYRVAATRVENTRLRTHPRLRPGLATGISLLLVLFVTAPASARTITLTADDCDQMAVISETHPRLGWAVSQMGPGVYETYQQLNLFPDMAILMRFPLDSIPRGQRITKAEFSFPVVYVGNTREIHLRRLLTEWGTGVCHAYRVAHPKKREWAKPGAKGITSDRANKPSAVFRLEKPGTYTADVTEDAELWYTRAVPNRGWVISLDEGGAYFTAFYPNGSNWKLQITYEPQ